MYRLVIRHDVGGEAPGFAAKDASGREISLESYRDKSCVVLIFFTGGYDREAMRNLRALAESYPRIRDSDAEVIAVAPELPGKVQTLMESMSLPFPVLSDPEMRLVREYDVYDPDANWTYPAGFIIDKSGIIQYVFRGVSPPNTPPVDYLLMKLTQMKEGKAPSAPTRAKT